MKVFENIEQGSDAWRTLRAGIPTASEFSRIVTSDGSPSKSRYGYALDLAAEAYAMAPMGDSWGGNAWTERGKELEAEALARYEFQTDAKVSRVGFVMNDAGTVGCSPDGMVGLARNPDGSVSGVGGLVEIKILKSGNHVAAILRYKKDRTVDPSYVQQTQGQMWVTGAPWCDLVFYSPQLPLLIARQGPDERVIDGLIAGTAALIVERETILKTLRAA